MKYGVRVLLTLVCWLGMTIPAWANNNEALLELLKALHENGTINAETYQLVKQVAEQGQAEAQAPVVAETQKEAIQQVVREEVAAATKDQPKINTKGKFEVTSPDGDFSFRVGGRVQVDAATFDEDRLNHNDGTEFRRTRLFVQGRLWHDWGYKFQYDFVDSGSDGIRDAYLDYDGIDRWKVRVGNFKEPFSLQNMTSSKYITFQERGLPFLFTPGRNIGLGASTSGNNWSFAAGVFGEGVNGADANNDEGYGASGRVTFAPILGEGRALHLGASGSWRATGSGDSLRFRERPEAHMTDTRLVDTGNIDTDDFSRFAGEGALIYGPLSLAGEYYHLSLNRDVSANPDLDFSGYYAEAGWFLTGESMNYSGASGSFGKIMPRGIVGKGGMGAWQLALRFSSIDLSDEDIRGGEEQNLTAGINWFATPNIRFIANYVNVLDVDGGPGDNDEPDIFQMRAQVEF